MGSDPIVYPEKPERANLTVSFYATVFVAEMSIPVFLAMRGGVRPLAGIGAIWYNTLVMQNCIMQNSIMQDR